jgi:hypothetical protein
MADITLPDGSRIPEYALESTQAEIMKLILSQVKADEKSFKLYTKLVENSAEQLKDNDNLQDLQDEQVEALKGIRKDAKTGANLLGSGINFISDKLVKMGTLGVSAAITAFSTIAKSTYNLGDTIASIANVGLAFDDVNGNTVSAITSLNRLGLSSKEAAELMAGSAGAIAQMGKQGFTEFTSAAARMTNSGAEFGLTMSELAGIASDDLDIRRRLGILDQLNATSAAKRSTDLYSQQLKATSILGKSIDAIQDAANLNMDNNAEMALRIQSIASKFNPGIADGFIKSLQTFQGNLAASGLSEDIIASIGNEIGASVAFASEQGQELFATLSYVGDRFDSGLTTSIQKMNELAKTNPEKVGAEMANFQNQLMSTASKMSDVEFEELSQMLLSGGMGEMGKQFALSIGEMRIASKKFGDDTAKQLSTLAQGSKTFDNAMNQMSGGLSGILNDISGALGPTVGSLASAFEDVIDENGKVAKDGMGISTAFKIAMTDISGALSPIFGDLGEDGKNLGDALREYVVPALQEFGAWFKEGGAQKIKDALITFKDLVVGITAPFRGLFNLLTGDLEGAKNSMMGAFDSLGGKIGLAVGGFVLLNKTLAAASAGNGIVSKVMGLFGKGGGGAGGGVGETVGKAGGGALGGIGKGIGALGKGIGKGIGGVFKGLAIGIGAFANPKILIGAGILAGSILLIGGAVAGATWMMGKALPTMAEGLEAFENINGNNLIDVGLGMLAVGGGIAAMGAGNVIGAVGNLVGGAFDKLNDLLGGPSIMDRVAEFAKWNIDVGRVENNSHALVAYGRGMGALGAAQGLAGIGNYISFISDSLVSLLGGDTPLEKVQKFSEMKFNKEGINDAADAIFLYSVAMSRLADVGIPGATLSGLISDLGQGLLAYFGAESPLDKLKAFGEYGLNAPAIVANARAIIVYATAMSALKGVDVKDIDRATSGLLSDRSMAAYERLKAFSEMDIGAWALMDQGRGIDWFSKSMQSLAEVDADAAVTAIEKLAKAYGSFSMLNPEKLVAVAEGMAAINDNAQQGVSLGSMDMGVAISTGLADLKASKTTLNTKMGKSPTTTGLGDLKADTTNPTPSPQIISSPVIRSEEARKDAKPTDKELPTETLESLIRKTNVKLDSLITETQRNR